MPTFTQFITSILLVAAALCVAAILIVLFLPSLIAIDAIREWWRVRRFRRKMAAFRDIGRTPTVPMWSITTTYGTEPAKPGNGIAEAAWLNQLRLPAFHGTPDPGRQYLIRPESGEWLLARVATDQALATPCWYTGDDSTYLPMIAPGIAAVYELPKGEAKPAKKPCPKCFGNRTTTLGEPCPACNGEGRP